MLISALLYIYATHLKRTLLLGNIVVSVLVGMSILIVGIFELLPAITVSNQSTQIIFFKVVFDYALFASVINLLREISKDIEDIDGDHKAGMNTLPIALGRARAKNVLTILNFIPLVSITFYVATDLYKEIIAVCYFLVLVIGPLIYINIKIYMASAKEDFHFISNMYKLVMLFGMLSLLLYKYIILN